MINLNAIHLRDNLTIMHDISENRINELIEALAGEISLSGKKVTVAESCTGGWIAKSLTDFAGSSAWFEYGFITYGDNAKQELLGVLQDS